MSDVINDFSSMREIRNTDQRHHRRRTMVMLVRTLVDLSDGFSDPADPKHRAEIAQLTTIIGSMSGRIAQADDQTFAMIITEAEAIIPNLRRREVEIAGDTLH